MSLKPRNSQLVSSLVSAGWSDSTPSGSLWILKSNKKELLKGSTVIVSRSDCYYLFNYKLKIIWLWTICIYIIIFILSIRPLYWNYKNKCVVTKRNESEVGSDMLLVSYYFCSSNIMSIQLETRHLWILQYQCLHNMVIRSVYNQSSTCDKCLV